MKDEIIHFYLENKTPIDKIISIGMGKMGLSRASLEEALVRVYDEIQGGEEVKPIRVAWNVYALAKLLKITADDGKPNEIANIKTDAKENDVIAKLNNEIVSLTNELDKMKSELDAAQTQIEQDKLLKENAKIEINNLLDESTKIKKQILWYKQSWWKRVFRRPANV